MAVTVSMHIVIIARVSLFDLITYIKQIKEQTQGPYEYIASHKQQFKKTEAFALRINHDWTFLPSD